MSPGARRVLIPLVVGALAVSVVLAVAFQRSSGKAPSPVAEPAAAAGQAEVAAVPEVQAAAERPAPVAPAAVSGASASGPPLVGLRATAPPTGESGHARPPAAIGSLDPAESLFRVEFSRAGAGIQRITLSAMWDRASARRQAEAYWKAVKAHAPPPDPLPDDEFRYVLGEAQPLASLGPDALVPTLAAIRIVVNGQAVNLFDYRRDDEGNRVFIWSETAPGAFETLIHDESGAPVLRITRRFTLGAAYDLLVEQRVENLTDRTLTVEWIQFGPGSLPLDRSRYMDRRRFRFGYLPDPVEYPDRSLVLADDNDVLLERAGVLKRWDKSEKARRAGDFLAQREFFTLWPNETSREKNYELSWFSATNRYFGLTVHPVFDEQGAGSRSLAGLVARIETQASDPDPARRGREHQVIFTHLISPPISIAAGDTAILDMGLYAGPLDAEVLEQAPYEPLAMEKLILYQMSSFCAVCTFQWLAHGLLGFLDILHHYVLFDWGLAIIGLVIVVRTLLHPITKKSQVSIQRFGKQMSAMKPELDKLQKKFPNDPKKLQKEQMRLMREHGANPLQMLGCLPMLLQTPIWIALYAMLYFAFGLRQEAAFFGLFQTLTGGAWPFLADLSAADHFFGEVDEPFRFLMWNITGFNLLPIMMGGIFYVQQKYMAPPPSPTMTQDQLRQQKMMKIMMVVLFPVMLYSAPSGLTLYILTSSTVGIIESRYIRRHITAMDLKGKTPTDRTRAKPKDAQGRAFAAALERMEEKRRKKAKGPEKKYKKRK